MPRKPEPTSKTNQLVIKSNDPLDQQKFKAVREIVARNPELTIKKALMPGVELFLREHNWPPGNSQLPMTRYLDEQLVEKRKCEHPNCDEDAECIGFAKPPGKSRVYLCNTHRKQALENQLLKSYRPLKK